MNMGKISVRFQRDGPKCRLADIDTVSQITEGLCRPRAVARGQRRICISLLEGVEPLILDIARPGWPGRITQKHDRSHHRYR